MLLLVFYMSIAISAAKLHRNKYWVTQIHVGGVKYSYHNTLSVRAQHCGNANHTSQLHVLQQNSLVMDGT